MERTFGVELEVEGVSNTSSKLEYWTIKEDSSLRHFVKNKNRDITNNITHKGMEFTFKQGYDINNSMFAMYELEKLIKQMGESLYPSNRCSTHVHVSVKEEEILNQLFKYLYLEKSMYKIAGYSRYNNNFCVPLLFFLPAMIRGYNSFKTILKTYEKGRYLGLNILSYEKFRTIEFRQLRSTLNTSSIIEWINLIDRLVNYKIDFTEKNSLEKIIHMNEEILTKKYRNFIDIPYIKYIHSLLNVNIVPIPLEYTEPF